MNKVAVSEEQLEPEELTSLSPTQLSYWIASVFQDSRWAVQACSAPECVCGSHWQSLCVRVWVPR
jgi:hypothetical protein